MIRQRTAVKKSKAKVFLDSFDFLGRDVKLTFKGKEKFTTKVSLSLSFFILISFYLFLLPYKLLRFV